MGLRAAAWILLFGTLGLPQSAMAVCASVKIEIVQELTLERQAFDARLQILNETESPIENLLVTVTYATTGGADRADQFYTTLTSVSGMSGSPDGRGSVPGGGSADIHWLIIPEPGAGGETAAGVPYLVGATLSFVYQGESRTEVMEPDTIVVLPMPLLQLDYFLPTQVIGDDPYTPQTEPPVPYPLGVRVANNGFGTAQHLKIESGQPEIVENSQGLLIGFVIIGSEVNGAPGTTSLLADFGDIAPGEAGVGLWELVTTLSGEFISFDASFVHDDALGGEQTSLIEAVETHTLVHEVVVDLEGRDTRKDFLGTESTVDPDLRVYESDNEDAPVEDASDSGGVEGQPAPSHPSVRVTCNPSSAPFYVGVPDPGAGRFRLASVYRADGKRLRAENSWISAGWSLDTHQTSYTLGIFDVDGLCDFIVTYEVSTTPDTAPPQTEVWMLEPYSGEAPVCVTSETEFIFGASDSSSAVASMSMALDGDSADLAAYFPLITPFRFALRPALEEGPHAVHYFATDASGNAETPNTLNVLLDDSPPIFSGTATAAPTTLYPSAPPTSGKPRASLISFQLDDVCGPARMLLEVSAGQTFTPTAVLTRQEIEVPVGVASSLSWGGAGSDGAPLPPGTYSLRLTPQDALEQAGAPVTLQLQVVDPLEAQAVSAHPGANQLNPVLNATRIAWQDDRLSDWDIYMIEEGGPEERIWLSSPVGANQTYPALGDQWLAFLDDQSGVPKVWTYYLDGDTPNPVNLEGEHGPPSIEGENLVFDAKLDGQWDLYHLDLYTWTLTRLTQQDRDQRHPVISGDTVYFEDYRDGGKPEVYALSLLTGLQWRVTVEPGSAQWGVTSRGNVAFWMDNRQGNTSIYGLNQGEDIPRRMTYGSNNHTTPNTDGQHLVFIDQGSTLVWGAVRSGTARALKQDTVHREHPVVYGDHIVWVEEVGGTLQLMETRQHLADLELPFRPGLSLSALPAEVLSQGSSARALLSAWNPLYGVNRLAQSSAAGTWSTVAMVDGVVQGADFSLVSNRAVLAYGTRYASLPVETLEPSPLLSFGAGVNAVGIGDFPYGYGAQDLAASVGIGSVRWVRHFKGASGQFEVLGVQNGALSGTAFPFIAGEGVLLDLSGPVTGWRP